MKLDNNNHSVFALYYHLVLVVKYRRNVFDDDISFTVQKRYSELKTMHDSLRRETNSNSFPKFPPKKLCLSNTLRV